MLRRRPAAECGDRVDAAQDHENRPPDQVRARDPPDAATAAPALVGRAARRDRLQIDLRQPLVAQLVLLDERSRVKPERVGVRAQEALDERRSGQQVPFLVLEGAQVLGADLRLGLDLRDVDPGTHPRLAQGRADLGHVLRTLSGLRYWPGTAYCRDISRNLRRSRRSRRYPESTRERAVSRAARAPPAPAAGRPR